jgi:hypothetical protein
MIGYFKVVGRPIVIDSQHEVGCAVAVEDVNVEARFRNFLMWVPQEVLTREMLLILQNDTVGFVWADGTSLLPHGGQNVRVDGWVIDKALH